MSADVPIPMDSILMEESIDELEFGEELSQGKGVYVTFIFQEF